MRIASWNINGVKGRLDLLLDWLCAQKPDLVALQKIRARREVFPFDAFDRAGYHAEAHCCRPGHPYDYGVAILSRREPLVRQKGLPGQEERGPRLLTVEVDGLEFSSVYAPAATKKKCSTETRIEWFERLTEHLKTTRPASGRRVLCGDFNVVAVSRFGSSGRKSSVRGDEHVRARFGAMLKEAGLLDLYEVAPPDWKERFAFEGHDACLKFSRLEYMLGTQSIVSLNPVVRFDIDHAIERNPPYDWVCAPIIACLSK